MQLPLQIAFRNMKPSEEIETLVRDRATKLNTFADHIMGCRVVVEPKGKHRRHGNLYDVRIDVTVPGEVILATRLPDDCPEYREIQVAVRDAFDAVDRQLEDYVRRTRGFVKAHSKL